MISNWRASEASETLSSLFNRESRYIYYSTYVCHICPLTLKDPVKKVERNFEIATGTLCSRENVVARGRQAVARN